VTERGAGADTDIGESSRMQRRLAAAQDSA